MIALYLQRCFSILTVFQLINIQLHNLIASYFLGHSCHKIVGLGPDPFAVLGPILNSFSSEYMPVTILP